MRRGIVALLTGAVVAVALAVPARALPSSEPGSSGMVSYPGAGGGANAVAVRTLAEAQGRIWVGGIFTEIDDASGAKVADAGGLAAFDADTGQMPSGLHIPIVTASTGAAIVYALSLGPDGSLYLAGHFDHVDGIARKNVAAIDPSTGGLLPFAPAVAKAFAVLATPSAVYVGTSKLLSFQPNGVATPGWDAPVAIVNPDLRGHVTPPQFRDVVELGNTLVATCQCDSLRDVDGTRTVKAVVEIDASSGRWIDWRAGGSDPSATGYLPDTSAAFGVAALVHDYPGTSNPTVYLAAGGSDFTAAYDFTTGAQRFKTDTSGSSQAIAWYQGQLVVGGHFDWTQSPAAPACGSNAAPNPDCYFTPKLVAMDAATGDVLPDGGAPWNPGICCKYNGVWALLVDATGSTLHVGGEFTRAGGAWTCATFSGACLSGDAKHRFYTRFGGPPAGPVTLSVVENGSGSGTVASDVGGIDCPTVCSVAVDPSTSVTLTAAPSPDSIFVGWGGACAGSGGCQVVMNADEEVTATFALARTLTASVTGDGTVTSDPAGIACPSTCSGSFADGAVVGVAASPALGWVLSAWSGDCAGSGPCQLTMDATKSVAATFVPGWSLVVSKAGGGRGTVSSDPGGIDCGATCSAGFTDGATVTLSATPEAGSTFDGWSGEGCTGAGPCEVTMTQARALTATFSSTGAVGSIEETDPTVAFDGWVGVSDASASGGAYRRSDVKNDKARWRSPVSSSLTWFTREGPDMGKATVLVDGAKMGVVDLYDPTPQPSSLTFPGLSSKAHTVIVKVTGNRNAASSGSGVVIDAFAADPVLAEESSVDIKYDTWAGATSAKASGGSFRWAKSSGASLSVTFTGTSIDWITQYGPAYGRATVAIDGVDRGTVDLYASSLRWEQTVGFGGLSPGTHTITIDVLGQKDAAARSTKVAVDRFDIGS